LSDFTGLLVHGTELELICPEAQNVSLKIGGKNHDTD
jgi:hypothetical protein